MALVIDLKPNEKVIIGNAVITNDSQKTRLHINGDAPILREKDVLKEEDADTPCKQVYFIIQLMYLANDPTDHYDEYFRTIRNIKKAEPSTGERFNTINPHILEGAYYKALKETKKLIEYEKELMAP